MLWTRATLLPVMLFSACHDLDADPQVCLTLADGTGKVVFRPQHTACVEMQTLLYHKGSSLVPHPSGGVGFASAELLGVSSSPASVLLPHITCLLLPVGWFWGDSDLSIFVLSWPRGKLRPQLPRGHPNGQELVGSQAELLGCVWVPKNLGKSLWFKLSSARRLLCH